MAASVGQVIIVALIVAGGLSVDNSGAAEAEIQLELAISSSTQGDVLPSVEQDRVTNFERAMFTRTDQICDVKVLCPTSQSGFRSR